MPEEKGQLFTTQEVLGEIIVEINGVVKKESGPTIVSLCVRFQESDTKVFKQFNAAVELGGTLRIRNVKIPVEVKEESHGFPDGS